MEEPGGDLLKTVREMMENVREMIATSKLLRSRFESNDEVIRLVHNKLGQIETYQAELDRRLTKMENEHPHHVHKIGHSGAIACSKPLITNRNRIGGDT